MGRPVGPMGWTVGTHGDAGVITPSLPTSPRFVREKILIDHSKCSEERAEHNQY